MKQLLWHCVILLPLRQITNNIFLTDRTYSQPTQFCKSTNPGHGAGWPAWKVLEKH